MKKTYTSSGESCIVVFELPRPAAKDARDVRVLGEFNGWSWEDGVRLSPHEHGFRAHVELPVGRDYQFRFLIDGDRWENQWDADAYVATPFGVDNSVVSLDRAADGHISADTVSDAADTMDEAPDDLTDIEGIGPAIARLLNGAGISTFTQLARTDARSIRAMLDAGGTAFAMHDPTTWPEQAFLAGRGDVRALAALQERLIAGRRPEEAAS